MAAAEESRPLDLVKAATPDSGSSYGEITIDSATKVSLKSLLGNPISTKERSSVWIGTAG